MTAVRKVGRPRLLTDAQRKEHRRTSSREWWKNNKAQHRATVRARTHKDPAWSMWSAAKKRAKNEGLPFNIERSDIIIPTVCPVLGVVLEKADGYRTDFSPSLDKFKPDLGYVKGNIHVISSRANRIKTDATEDEIRQLLHWMESIRGA